MFFHKGKKGGKKLCIHANNFFFLILLTHLKWNILQLLEQPNKTFFLLGETLCVPTDAFEEHYQIVNYIIIIFLTQFCP